MSHTGFSDSPSEDPSTATVHLLPAPLEATVSYGGGTALGPQAILEASYQLENYDREFRCEPNLDYGIYTWPALHFSVDGQSAHQKLEERVKEIYKASKLLGVLGGEHSLSAPVVRGILAHRNSPITIVQIDAHADLRDSYEGSPLSHACVGRRFLEISGVEQVLQLGIRSLCQEEADLIATEPRLRTWFSEDIHRGDYIEEFQERLESRDVYLTIDVDGFDPSVMPSTGTPEPDGLNFRQVENIIRTSISKSQLLAFDCVELAPMPNFHSPDFMVAKLLYRLMNLHWAKGQYS